MRGEFRVGRVSSVDKARHTAQVHFEDHDEGMVSWDLQVLVTRKGDYSLPDKDTPVLCVLLDGNVGFGFVLGAIYTESDEAPLDNADHRSIAGDDIRLGDPEADKKAALAPATKDEIQKAVDYAEGIALAIQGGVATPQDGGAGLKGTIVALLPQKPTIEEPACETVSIK